MENRALVFVHIPKTAGTSFTDFLAPNYTEDEFIKAVDTGCPPILRTSMIESKKLPEIGGIPYLHQIPKEKFQTCKLMRGHYYLSIFDLFFDIRPHYVTMFRNPIAHIVSFYNHFIQRMPEGFMYEKAQSMSFLDFLRDKEVMFWYKDLQTQYIAKEMTADENYVNMDFDYDLHKRVQQRYVDTPDDVLFENAKKRLENFACVGIVEKYQESIALLSYCLHLKPALERRPLNVASQKRVAKDALTKEEIEAIKNITRVDHRVYEYAKNELEKKYKAMVQDLVVSDYKKRNRDK